MPNPASTTRATMRILSFMEASRQSHFILDLLPSGGTRNWWRLRARRSLKDNLNPLVVAGVVVHCQKNPLVIPMLDAYAVSNIASLPAKGSSRRLGHKFISDRTQRVKTVGALFPLRVSDVDAAGLALAVKNNLYTDARLMTIDLGRLAEFVFEILHIWSSKKICVTIFLGPQAARSFTRLLLHHPVNTRGVV